MSKEKISHETFEGEIKICQEQSKANGCAWGKCKDCGVVPLLVKLHRGMVVEDQEEISEIKKKLRIIE